MHTPNSTRIVTVTFNKNFHVKNQKKSMHNPDLSLILNCRDLLYFIYSRVSSHFELTSPSLKGPFYDIYNDFIDRTCPGQVFSAVNPTHILQRTRATVMGNSGYHLLSVNENLCIREGVEKSYNIVKISSMFSRY